MTLGVPAYAVGCLPAPLSLRSSAKSRRRLPFSPPNATATAKAAPWTWDAGQKRTLKGQGAFWRGSIDELRRQKAEGQEPASGERTTGALKDGGRSAPARSRKTSLAGALRRCSIERIGSDCPPAGALLKNTGPAGRTLFCAGYGAPAKQAWRERLGDDLLWQLGTGLPSGGCLLKNTAPPASPPGGAGTPLPIKPGSGVQTTCLKIRQERKSPGADTGATIRRPSRLPGAPYTARERLTAAPSY